MSEEFLSKEALLTAAFGVVSVPIPGKKGAVQVRPLSRTEALSVQGVELTTAEVEQKLLSKAMVRPKLTEEEVEVWQNSSKADEIEPVANKIMELSGMRKESAKEAVKTFRDES